MLPLDHRSDFSKDKPRAGCLLPTRDGRLHISLQFAATLSHAKAAFLAALLLIFGWLFLSPTLGLGVTSSELSLRARVTTLEGALGKRLAWLAQHGPHLQSHVSRGGAAWAPTVHPDGRKHLLSDPDGVSRLAEFVAPATALPPVDDHYLCGEAGEVTEAEVVRKKLAIVVITWRAPLSLRHSLRTWSEGGLLELVDEKMLFINSPSQEDFDIAKEYDFDVYTTDERNGNVMAGPALTYLVGNTSADYVLFMEKDFALNSPKAVTARELYHGVHMLARGVDVYRLRGATDYPAEGMPDCCTPATPPTCPYHSNWRSGGYFGDHMNWLLIWCQENPVESANGRLALCSDEPSAPKSLCFGSGDTNWSNNPLIMPKAWYLDKLRDVSLNGEKAYTQNNMFELCVMPGEVFFFCSLCSPPPLSRSHPRRNSNVMMEWLPWRPPAKVCVSYQGIFTHQEIDQ